MKTWYIQDSDGSTVCEREYVTGGNDSTQNIRDSVVIETCCLVSAVPYTLVCESMNERNNWDYDNVYGAPWMIEDKAYVSINGETYCDGITETFAGEISYTFTLRMFEIYHIHLPCI